MKPKRILVSYAGKKASLWRLRGCAFELIGITKHRLDLQEVRIVRSKEAGTSTVRRASFARKYGAVISGQGRHDKVLIGALADDCVLFPDQKREELWTEYEDRRVTSGGWTFRLELVDSYSEWRRLGSSMLDIRRSWDLHVNVFDCETFAREDWKMFRRLLRLHQIGAG